MGKTHLHIEVSKFKNDVLEYDDLSVKTKRFFERHNLEIGTDRNLRNIEKLKQLKREFGV